MQGPLKAKACYWHLSEANSFQQKEQMLVLADQPEG